MKHLGLYSLSEAAERIGVSPITLKRWLLSEKVSEVNRDRNGWRVFNDSDVERIKKYAQQLVPPKRAR
jgi:DNA-binding transcriptional MerR regulator